MFIACSLDGFIAGPNDELDWLTDREGVEDTFTPFFARVGCLLMGRRTFDVIRDFEGPWPYGETPIRVASHRPLESTRPSAQRVCGTIAEMVAEARTIAGDLDVYLDGGRLIRSALDAGLVDELIVTVIPVILGAGIPLFAGTERRHDIRLLGTRGIGGGLVELRYAPTVRPVP